MGPLPDSRHIVAWQVVQIDYADYRTSKKLYRMFLPGGGTVFYNGFSLPIEESENEWLDLDESIGREDSTIRYFCVVKDFKAHVLSEPDYERFKRSLDPDAPGIQADFPVAEIKTGNGGEDSSSDEPGGDFNILKTRGLIVTTDNGFYMGEPHQRPGANQDAVMWGNILSNMALPENVMHLADAQTDLGAINGALDLVCNTSGLTVFMISTHGATSGAMEIRDGLLYPADLAIKFAQSPGPVWFIADCCYSGNSVSHAAPSSFAAKFVADVGAYLKANAPGVPYLGWASTTAEDLGWSTERGSIFTLGCYRIIRSGMTFAEAWSAVSTDPEVTQMEQPTKVVVNGFDETQPIFNLETRS